jgi:hypothetical protein
MQSLARVTAAPAKRLRADDLDTVLGAAGRLSLAVRNADDLSRRREGRRLPTVF